MTISAPTSSPSPGIYGPTLDVTLLQNANLPIAYTMDGSDPSIKTPSISLPFSSSGPFDLCFGPSGRMIATGLGSVYYSDDSGLSWSLVSASPPNRYVYGIAYSQSDSCYYVSFYSIGIYKLNLSLTNYTPCTSTDSANYPFKVRVYGNEVYSIGKVVHKSVDAGASWTFVCSPNLNTYASGNIDSDGNLYLVTGDASSSQSLINKFTRSTGIQSTLKAIPFAITAIKGVDGAIYVGQISPAQTFRSTDELATVNVIADNFIEAGVNYLGKTWVCHESLKTIINIADSQGVATEISNGSLFVSPIHLTQSKTIKAKSPGSSVSSFSYTISSLRLKIKGTFSGSGVKVFCAMPSSHTFEVPLSSQTTTELTIAKDFIATFGPSLGRVRILVVDGEYISEWKDWDFRI